MAACANQGDGNFVMNEKTVDEFFHTGKLIQNESDDLAGTYKGEGGTAVIKKTDDAILLENRTRPDAPWAELSSRVNNKPLPDGFTSSGKKAENAYVITADLIDCPKAGVNEEVLVVENNYIHNANPEKAYVVSKNGNELTIDFSMPANRPDYCKPVRLTKAQ